MKEIMQQLLDAIKQEPHGTSCLQLSKKLAKNRVTVAKYLEILKANNLIEAKQVAQANLWIEKKDRRKKILIIDDEEHIVTLIRMSLSSLDAKILSAYDGMEGLRTIYEEKPSLIILDLMMPHMSGYDVYERLKSAESTKHIPIIILTAKTDTSKRLNKMLDAKDIFMNKPFDPVELETNIRLMLATEREPHPLTGLHSEQKIQEDITRLDQKNTGYYLCVLKFPQLSAIKKKVGFSKTNELIRRCAEVFAEMKKEEIIRVAQTKDNAILILSRLQCSEDVKHAFSQIAPYLHTERIEILCDEFDQRELKATKLERIVQ